MTARWITADVFDGLAGIEDGTVDLVVTSPPLNGSALPVRLLSDSTVERLHLDSQLFETPSNPWVPSRGSTAVTPDRDEGLRNKDSTAAPLEGDIAEPDGLVGGGVGLAGSPGSVDEAQHRLSLDDGGHIEPSPVVRGIEGTDLQGDVGLSGLDSQIRAQGFECPTGGSRMNLPDVDRPGAPSFVVPVDIEVPPEQILEQLDGSAVDLLHLQTGLIGDVLGVSNDAHPISLSVQTDVSIGVHHPGAIGKLYRFVHAPQGSTLVCRREVIL